MKRKKILHWLTNNLKQIILTVGLSMVLLGIMLYFAWLFWLRPEAFCVRGSGDIKSADIINGDTVYCDSNRDLWTPTLDLPTDYNEATEYFWSKDCYGTEIGILAQSETEYMPNTNAMLEYCDDKNSNPAERCASLEYGGYADWYLPAAETLEQLYKDAGSEPSYDENARDEFYWSSTEIDATSSYDVYFSVGKRGPYPKEGKVDHYIRCVRQQQH